MKRVERGAGWLARRIAGPGTGRPAPLSAVRMALAVALPLLLGLAGGRLDLGSVGAIAALFTAIVEPGGGYRRHAQVYAVVTALNIVVVVLAVQVAHAALAAAVVMLALGVLAGLASAWGEVPTMAAPAPLGLFILAQGLHPTPRLADAVLAVLIGSGWVVVLSVLPWPIAPFAPAELAVSDAWLSVAAFARDPTSTRLEMRAINAIEDGREVVAVIRSRRAGWSDRSHRLWAALVAAQRVTALISAVADDRRKAPADPSTRAAMDHMLTQVSLTAADIATCTMIPRGRPDLTALHDAATTVHATVPSPDGLTGPPLHTALVAAGRARAAKRLLLRVREAVDALDLPEVPSIDIPAPASLHLMDQLRAALTWKSTALRHGLRLGAATGISMGVFTALGPGGILGVTHGAWVTLTLMAVLRPTLGDSVEMAMQRTIGTAIGGVVAVGMLVVLPAQAALVGGIIVVSTLAALLSPVNAMWFVILFTPIPLVFAASGGASGTDLMWERLTATGLACTAGMIIATLLWPTRSAHELPQILARALRTDARDADAMIATVIGELRPGAASEAQRGAMLAADEATRVAQAQIVESLTVFLHPTPIIALEAAVLKLPREIAVLGVRAWKDGTDIPGIDAVRAEIARSLEDIATAIGDRLPPAPETGLVDVLDPAWEALRRSEAAGTPDVRLAAAVDALDAVLHGIERIADDAAVWAASGTGRDGPWFRRLAPAPRMAQRTSGAA